MFVGTRFAALQRPCNMKGSDFGGVLCYQSASLGVQSCVRFTVAVQRVQNLVWQAMRFVRRTRPSKSVDVLESLGEWRAVLVRCHQCQSGKAAGTLGVLLQSSAPRNCPKRLSKQSCHVVSRKSSVLSGEDANFPLIMPPTTCAGGHVVGPPEFLGFLMVLPGGGEKQHPLGCAFLLLCAMCV